MRNVEPQSSQGSRAVRLVLCVMFAGSLLVAAADAQTPKAESARDAQKRAAKLVRSGHFRDAEAALRAALGREPERSGLKVDLAYVLTKQRRLLDAYELGYTVARAEPKNSRAFAVLGYTLVTAGKFSEARPVLLNAIKLKRSEHLAWAAFGLLDFYENKLELSLTNLQEAVTYAPREPDYWFALAQVAARSERYKESAEAYKNFLSVSSSADKERRDRIRGLIEFLKYLGEIHQLYIPAGKPATTVTFELEGDRPVVELRINDKDVPLRFVLDTGSGISVISDETANRLGIKAVARGGFAKGIGGDGRFEIVYGMLRQVDIGDVTVKNVPVYIREFHSLDGRPVDGYIGLSLISKFLATIDYGQRSFALTRKETDERAPSENARYLPLRLTSSGFLSGEVEVEGIDSTLNFIVDTGAGVSVISERMARMDVISRYVNASKLRVVGSAGITDDVPTFMLPRVSFGKHARRDIMAVALDLDMINEASGFEQAGILGGNFLKNYRLTFDFKNSKVVFEPIAADN